MSTRDVGLGAIIRCRNEERWIGYAIQSVLDFHPSAEILVMDDDSTDESMRIVKMFCFNDVKIRKVDSYSPGRALNCAVKEITKENVLILSAHCQLTSPVYPVDLIDPVTLRPHCAVWGKQTPVLLGKRMTPRYLWANFGDLPAVNYKAPGEDNRYFLHNALALYKTEFLREFPFDESLAGKEDRYWAAKMIEDFDQTVFYNPKLTCLHHWTRKGATWQDE